MLLALLYVPRGGKRTPCLRDEKLAKGVATLAERKWVSEVLTVLKHALFKAITIAAGGIDPDDGNQVRHTREAPCGKV